MVRTTKIACDDVIYTVREDLYGSTIEADASGESDDDEFEVDGEAAMQAERERYAGVLHELSEYEQAVADAEAQAAREDEQINRDDENIVDSLY